MTVANFTLSSTHCCLCKLHSRPSSCLCSIPALHQRRTAQKAGCTHSVLGCDAHAHQLNRELDSRCMAWSIASSFQTCLGPLYLHARAPAAIRTLNICWRLFPASAQHSKMPRTHHFALLSHHFVVLQLLSVEGPSVFMETFYVGYIKGVDTYSVSAVLEGSSFLPVTATVTISQRKLTSQGTARNGVVVYQVGHLVMLMDQLLGLQPQYTCSKHLSVVTTICRRSNVAVYR